MDNIKEIEQKFKEIGLETESERDTFNKNLLYEFDYKGDELICIQNTLIDDSTISNFKNDEICQTGTKF